MTQHSFEDVEKRLTQEPIYENTQLKIDFALSGEDGRINLSNDKVYLVGRNLTTGNKVFDVETTDQDAANGETRAVVSDSEIDEHGIFVFELQWDSGDNGEVNDRMQWKQEVKESTA